MKTYMLMVLAALCVFLWLRPEVEKGWEARNRVAALEWQVENLLSRPTPDPVVAPPQPSPKGREIGPGALVWVWVVVAAGAVAGLVLGFMVIAGAIVAPPRPSPKGREIGGGALHPGEPGFDEAVTRAAGAVGGVVLRAQGAPAQQPGREGAYWLCVPGREPVRVVRLLEDRGQ